MARTTKQLSGGGKDKFLRALIAQEPEISKAAGARLGAAMAAAIADIRVRREAWEAARDAVDASSESAAIANAQPFAAPAMTHALPPAKPAEIPTAAFDPFVFSALALLTKNGATALSAKLSEISAGEHLHALAKAQHLSVDAAISDVGVLRTAILAATEKRLAERRAAAS